MAAEILDGKMLSAEVMEEGRRITAIDTEKGFLSLCRMADCFKVVFLVFIIGTGSAEFLITFFVL